MDMRQYGMLGLRQVMRLILGTGATPPPVTNEPIEWANSEDTTWANAEPAAWSDL